MLSGNYDLLKNENIELQKRNQHLSELQAKLDLRAQQVEEELLDAKSLADSMRNENTHLKAEKDLWKSIEDRLSRDNENLINQRAQLNASIASLQSLQNERELSDAEMRRKHTIQVEGFEQELQSLKNRLNDEVEENKKRN
jgi:nucleoprotein TPR